METKNKIIIFLVIITAIYGIGLAGFNFAQALPTNQINVSAYLADGQGNEITNGDYDVRFSIYRIDRTTRDAYPSDADAGSRVWQETQKVKIINGIISTYLGLAIPIPATISFNDGDYYLGIRIGQDSEMTPRKKLSAVPIAINSLFLRGATTGTAAGNIPVLGSGGKMDVKSLPTGTSGSKLALANDSRFSDIHTQDTDTGTDSLSFNIGNGSAISGSNFDITVSGATGPPALRYSGSVARWQLSNNGTTFTNIPLVSDIHDPATLAGAYDYLTLSDQEITLGEINISDDTNLSGDTEIILTGDALSLASSITRDTEWDTWGEHPALTSAYILVGNGSNVATAVAMSGDVAITNAGVTAVGDNKITGAMIALGSDATGDIMYYNGTDYVRLADVAAGQPLLSGGVTTAPAYAGYTFSGTAAQTYTFPGTTGTLATLAGAESFTNKAGYNGLIITANTGAITTGSWHGTVIDADHGGTGQTVYAVGDLLYASTTTALSRLADVATGSVLISGGVGTAPSWGALSGIDHGSLGGLTDDDHSIYALLAGRAGGQTLKGDTASGGNLTLMSTAHATKGSILFGTSAYDEVNNRLGIGTATPAAKLQIKGSADATQFIITANATQANTNPLILLEKSDGTDLMSMSSDNPANLFIGLGAGRVNNITGTGDEGLHNSFIGNQSGYANTTGYENIGLGADTLNANTVGYKNMALGYGAMASNINGYNNVAIGDSSLSINTTGSNNVAIGQGAMAVHQSGSNNTVVGSIAGQGTFNNTYTNNTIIGYQAGFGLSSGSNNILLGYQAGDNLTTGANNLLIGYDIDAQSATGSSQLSIGNLIFGTGGFGTGTTVGAGNIGIGDTTPASLLTVGNGDLFQVDTNGDIIKLKNLTYSWPSAHTSSGVLTNNGSGTLTWATVGASNITADSLDFTELQDTLDLDADLILNQAAYTWTQNFTGAATTGLTYNANSLTSGGALNMASTATAFTGTMAGITLSGNNAANTGTLFKVSSTGALNTGTAAMITNLGAGLSFRVNDETGDADTTPFVIDASGQVGIGTASPGAKLTVNGHMELGNNVASSAGYALNLDENFGDSSGLGLYSHMTTTKTDGYGYGGYLSAWYDGTTNFASIYGMMGAALVSNNIGPKTITETAGVLGVSTVSGDNTIVTNSYGGKFTVATGYNMVSLAYTNAIAGEFSIYPGSGDVSINNAYGVKIASPSQGAAITGTLSNIYGLYINDQTTLGFANEYNFYSAGANTKNILEGSVGIGDTSPASLLTVGNGDLFQVDTNGDIIKLKNLTYSWPSAHTSSGVLTNNGSGTLTWATVGASNITADSLDFTELQDTLDLDADLILNQAAYTWTQNFTGAATTGLTYNANSLTSGGALSLASTATGFTGTMAGITLSGNNAANTGTLFKVSSTGALNTGTAAMITNLGAGLSFRVNDETGDADTTPFVIDASGQVGIGTASPSVKLHIVSTDPNGATAVGAILNTSSLWSTTGARLLSIRNNGAENLFVNSIGGIGIGKNVVNVWGGDAANGTSLTAFRDVSQGEPNYNAMILGVVDSESWNSFAYNQSYGQSGEYGFWRDTTWVKHGTSEAWADLKVQPNYIVEEWNIGGATRYKMDPSVFNTDNQLAYLFDTRNTLTAANIKLLSVNNNGVEKFYIDKDGVGYFAGNVGIGDSSPASLLTVGNGDLFQVDTNGDIIKLKNLTYSWPSAHTSSGVLTNNGSGTLTWATVGASNITADSLDFTELQDTLDLDADLILNQAAYTWTQNFTGAATTGLTYNANSLTSGGALNMASTATAFTGTMAGITLSGNNAANTGTLLKVSSTGALNTGTAAMITNLGAGLSFRVNDETGDADTTPFVIDASGNVGIGTTSPAAKLQIKGSADATQFIITANATQANTNPLILLEKSDGTDLMSIHSDDAANAFMGLNAGRVNNVTGVGSQGKNNTFIGGNAGYTNTTGESNTFVGYHAGYLSNAAGDSAFGKNALDANSSGWGNSAFGMDSLGENTGGYNNNAFGYAALLNNTNGYENSAFGTFALVSVASGLNNSAFGNYSGKNITGSNNTTIGYRTGYGDDAGSLYSNNSLFGYQSGYILTTGSNNILLGYQAGDNLTSGGTNLLIGYDIEAQSATGSSQLSIGNLIFGTGGFGTGTTVGAGNIGIGNASPAGKLHAYISNSAVTASSYDGYFENLATNATTDGINKYGMYITSTGTFTGGAGTATNNYGLYVNTPAGADNNYAAVFAGGNVGIGTASPATKLQIKGSTDATQFIVTANATQSNTNPLILLEKSDGTDLMAIHSDDPRNVFMGLNSGISNTLSLGPFGKGNTFVGGNTGYSNTTGYNNTAIGNATLYYNQTGASNTALGYDAGFGTDTYSFSNNSLFGYHSGYFLTTGSNNILLGYQAGDNLTSGGTNLLIGYDIEAQSATGSSQLSIGNLIFGTGGFGTGTTVGAGNIGIGDASPDTLLDLLSTSAANTQLTMTNTNAGDYDTQIGFQLAEGTNLFTIGVDDSDSDKFKISTAALGTGDRLTIDSAGLVSIPNLEMGALAFPTNAGAVSWMDLPVTSAATPAGTVESYSAQIDGNPILTVYAESDAADGIQDSGVGIGTTTPAYMLDVLATGTNIARFNGSNSTGCTLSDGGVIACSSDINLKKNVTDIGYGLETLMSLRPVEFNWNSESDKTAKSLGFIAQEVEGFLPKLVTTDDNGLKQLNSIGLIPVLTKSIQEQQGQLLAITNNQDTITKQIPLLTDGQANINDQISQILLKTDGNITTVEQLQVSVDENLLAISNFQLSISNEFSNLNDQNTDVSRILKQVQDDNIAQDNLIVALQTQIDELKKLTNQELNVAQIEANKTDLDYLKLLLGIERTKNGNINLLGNLEADGVVAGAFTVKVTEEKKKTIGTNYIEPVKIDEDKDGVDDKTGDDGITYIVKTKAVTESAKIFYGFETDPGSTFWVEKVKDKDTGEYIGFKAITAQPVKDRLHFNWWIVETDQ